MQNRVLAAPATISLGGIVIALIAFFTLVDLFATQAILPLLAHTYGVKPAVMGVAVNASTFGMAVGAFFTALFGDALDRRRGIVISLVVLTLPTALLAVAPDLVVFAILRVAQGLCMATAFTLTLSHLGEVCSPRAQANAFAAYITGNVASNLFGRLLAASAAGMYGLSVNFYVFAGLNLVGALLAFLSVRPGIMTPARRSVRERLGRFVAVASRPVLAGFGVGFCILFAFIGVFSYVNFILMAPPLGLGMMSLGLVYFVFVPSIVLTPLAGRAAARFGTRTTLWCGLGVAGLGIGLCLVMTLASVLAGLVLVGAGTFFAQATATGFISRAAGAHRSAASGLYLTSYFAGGLAGAAVLGQVFERWGWSACVAGVAIALLLAAALGSLFTITDANP
ncbi:MAG: MFS transporter [Asticcacaulis sp.]|nr:MFS transporter [Asticcacaulis sp.]